MDERRTPAPDAAPVAELAALIGVEVTPALLDEAMSHRSWCAEHPGHASNERLEFLGDAVLGLAAADIAFRRYPQMSEGQLTGVRKGVVNATALSEIGRELGLGRFVKLGRGESAAGGAAKASILSDAVEAVIGAVYVDRGVDAGFAFVERLLSERIDHVAQRLDELDFKSTLQEASASRGLEAPIYEISEEGPDHQKVFHALVFVGADLVGHGDGPSKRAAEQAAAAFGVQTLQDPSFDALGAADRRA